MHSGPSFLQFAFAEFHGRVESQAVLGESTSLLAGLFTLPLLFFLIVENLLLGSSQSYLLLGEVLLPAVPESTAQRMQSQPLRLRLALGLLSHLAVIGEFGQVIFAFSLPSGSFFDEALSIG